MTNQVDNNKIFSCFVIFFRDFLDEFYAALHEDGDGKGNRAQGREGT
jgi:hypothetical protein